MTLETAPAPAEHCVAAACRLLAESDRQLAARDRLQASATLWNAAAMAVMAVARQQGWPCDGSRRSLKAAVARLAAASKDDLIAGQYLCAENFRDNADLDFMDARALAYDGAKARDFVRRVLARLD